MSIPANLLDSLRQTSHESQKVARNFLCQQTADCLLTKRFRELPCRAIDFKRLKPQWGFLSQTKLQTANRDSDQPSRRVRPLHSGLAQLSIVEHALCPLDRNASLHGNRFNEAAYRFTDSSGTRRTAKVRVNYPLGLVASDEFYLWGLLALTLSQADKSNELHATPHYCLRQLGNRGTKGGRNYELFREAIRRLSAVSYQNTGFYDPIRAEHREVAFNFLSYSLPIDPASSRAWRLVWNPIFFEMCAASGSTLMFDLETYRELDEASRRLFLLLKKMFWRRKETPPFDVRELANQVLGFSSELSQHSLNQKVRGCVERLAERSIIDANGCRFEKRAKGVFSICFQRGAYFEARTKRPNSLAVNDSPLAEPLASIGLDPSTVGRILCEYPHSVLRAWVDITLAARERFGESFFKSSSQAYFIDNVKHATAGTRTAPDWWHDIRKAEDRRIRDELRSSDTVAAQQLSEEQQATFDRIADDLFRQFRSAGQSEMAARKNATQFAREHVLKSAQSLSSNLQALKLPS